MKEVLFNEVYRPEHEYKVLVKTITFNQSKYIQETLNGVAMQITSFPYVNIVLDDNSTDGEQEVIKSWLNSECDIDNVEYVDIPTAEVFIAPHRSNRYCTFAFYFHKQNLFRQKEKREMQIDPWRTNCTYEAMCEGDDYWTDPLKLQKQVDFLDSHPDYSFCCHRFNIYEQNTNRWLKEYAHNYYVDGRDLDISLELYSSVWVTQPLTMMARVSSLNEIKSDLQKYKSWRDVHLFYYLLKVGKGISLNRNMGVYRWHEGGIASGLSGVVRYNSAYSIYKELLTKTNDKLFRRPFVKNTIRLLRYKPFSTESIALFKEVWSYSCGWREKADILISFFTPLFIINKLSKRYRKQYLSNQVI